jgi:CRISPR-associated protein Cmr2
VSKVFWQAKICGLLHDPIFHDNDGSNLWQHLAIMADWVEAGLNPAISNNPAMEQLQLANLLTAASDRGAIRHLASHQDAEPQISHLLSGQKMDFGALSTGAGAFGSQGKQLLNLSIAAIDDDPQKVFWWLWRCLPIAACKAVDNNENLLLMPADPRIPDASIWSHTGLTAAMAGALTGFDVSLEDLKNWPENREPSRAYLATFTFSPVQELIKASRKMRDFWAGSWLLHYLSAKVCWRLALKYGPDSLVYPSLFQQPLIDTWLLARWPEFANSDWVKPPTERQLLTAGFPNVIVMVLPESKMDAAMQMAKQILKEEWLNVGNYVFNELQQKKGWMVGDRKQQIPKLVQEHVTWNGWLETQWQTYWSALPVGDRHQPLTISNIQQDDFWRQAQNQTFQVTEARQLFTEKEDDFLRRAGTLDADGAATYGANAGSWWPYVFDRTRASVASVKNARSWQLPTVFDSRSTISGLGSIVHPYPPKYKVTSAEAKALWQEPVGLFDGHEQLNATEVVKRSLHLVIPQIIASLENTEIDASYPDLTAGAIGYLRQRPPAHREYFQQACEAVQEKLRQRGVSKIRNLPQTCGIPWATSQADLLHPRYLSPGWLVEDIDIKEISLAERQDLKVQLDLEVAKFYPTNNPTSYYVLAAGDGDSMSEWLKGHKLHPYHHYVSPQAINDVELGAAFEAFLNEDKRMGPSTHAALSRALLDFSNQLVPYLTEQRYAGRLIYSGGDDVLAYTNLWEWDQWLWDIRRCFQGAADPNEEFNDAGDYWQWKTSEPPPDFPKRPLFTMGEAATISFGIVIANQGVPLAIALENMWEAEEKAKEHFCETLPKGKRKKNAVQVRVLYTNGNILTATAKFEAFDKWRCLLDLQQDAALFEQAAQVWEQHRLPDETAIDPWVRAFSDRREALQQDDVKQLFVDNLTAWLQEMYKTNDKAECDQEVGNWLKLAAFVIRKRDIKILGGEQ